MATTIPDILSWTESSHVIDGADLQGLDHFFLNYTYVCGHQPSIHDHRLFAKFTSSPVQKYPSIKRWYHHIASFTEYEQLHWPAINKPTGVKRKQEGPVNEKAKSAHTQNKHAAVKDTDDEDFDPFADGPSKEDTTTVKPRAPEKTQQKAKPKLIEKSQLIIHVKPASIDTDLDQVERLIRDIQIEGLTWSVAAKKIPIAYGLMKLQIGCVIVDELVQTDDVISFIECLGLTDEEKAKRLNAFDNGEDEEEEDDEDNIPGLVSSAEIVSFNKL